ncbi:MAG TPA: hypothetical protein VFH38_00185 [Jatrophihabitans sp.]|nr:hypothetical protein [Jatrophihabitans sp.]
MDATLTQAGARMLVECRVEPFDQLISEACGPALVTRAAAPPGDRQPGEPDIHLVVDRRTDAFDLAGWQPLTREAYHHDGKVVLHNACGSGFDLRVTVSPSLSSARIRLEARYRPPTRERLAAYGLRSRFHLLARAVLLQYPALWVAGTRGRAPLHAAAVRLDSGVALLAGPGGVGRSTMLLQALSRGAVACSDNLCVSDGKVVHGLVEPVRIEGAGGRRMPHGRGERSLPGRVDSLVPDRVVVLRRAAGRPTTLAPLPGPRAAEALVAGTYMAGELRRYWPFAATLTYGTRRGPVHPPIAAAAAALGRLPSVEITLGDRPVPTLGELLADAALRTEVSA